MNLTALLPLLKLLQDSGAVSPPPASPTPEPSEIKPSCGVGKYAYKDPLTGLWTCVPIPKGR